MAHVYAQPLFTDEGAESWMSVVMIIQPTNHEKDVHYTIQQTTDNYKKYYISSNVNLPLRGKGAINGILPGN